MIGAFAFFFAASIGFVSNFCVTPSRLTGIPSIGLMIGICAILELLLFASRSSSGWKRSTIIASWCALCCGLMFWSVQEVECFSALLRQSGEVSELDLRIANKIKILRPTLGADEEIFVRMPRAKRDLNGAWTKFSSGFNSGRAFETFWYLYKDQSIRFNCSWQGHVAEPDRMAQVLKDWQIHGVSKVYPFLVDGNENVFAVTRIDLTDKSGKVIRSLDFSRQHSNVPDALKITQRIATSELPAP